eukprot:581548-Amphidinium_carterae.1
MGPFSSFSLNQVDPSCEIDHENPGWSWLGKPWEVETDQNRSKGAMTNLVSSVSFLLFFMWLNSVLDNGSPPPAQRHPLYNSC